ncbi:hypothetical protein F4782DRAFT_480938 [Xylaria castorea]|nr:hypothetical protein F4782DRAFT_480938 [Xylaria castorea]
MPNSRGAEDSEADRPSFTGFWKRSKDKLATQSLTFVSSKLGQSSAHGGNEGQTEPSAEVKAKERRQQVRKAQRQHRQRKANYTKQLEMDITKLRDDIAQVEQEVQRLKNQNGTIRSQLGSGGDQIVPMAVDVPPPPVVDTMDPAFSTFLAPDYTVSLDMSTYLGTPAFQVRRASDSSSSLGSSSKTTSPRATETLSGTTPTSTIDTSLEAIGTSLEDIMMMEATLSAEQIDRAINFILALEHCCWNHMDQTCFEHHSQRLDSSQHLDPCPPAAEKPCAHALASMALAAVDDEEVEDDAALNGHALMATSLVLQSAPFDVFARMSDPQPPTPTPTTEGSAVEWRSRTLTLTNLRRLARSLNPSDSELAPVQVWFELVSLYGVAVATDAAVLRGLNRELLGEVHCVQFGAAVQRDVFENALEKVIEFLPWSWRAGFIDEGMMEGMSLGQEGGEDYKDMMGVAEGTGKMIEKGTGIARAGRDENTDVRLEGPS